MYKTVITATAAVRCRDTRVVGPCDEIIIINHDKSQSV